MTGPPSRERRIALVPASRRKSTLPSPGSSCPLARLTARRTYGGGDLASIGRTAYVTTAEAAEGAVAVPKRLVALTTTCTVFPTSAGVTA